MFVQLLNNELGLHTWDCLSKYEMVLFPHNLSFKEEVVKPKLIAMR